MASQVPQGAAGGDDEFVYESIKLQTAEEYKQHRKVQTIIDAQETFLDRRETAYEYFWEGRIGRQDYLKAIRMAVERYLMLSKQAIRESAYTQWFWRGEPPTIDGRSPYDETGKLIALRQNEEIELPNGGGSEKVSKVLSNGRYRIKKPVLVGDDEGKPVFGTDENILGILPMPEVDKQLVFQGLESYWQAEDPIIRQSDTVEPHPTKLRQTASEVHQYQIPEDVSKEAFDQINQFWWLTGMSVSLDRGQSIIREFDMSHDEKYVHTDGSPPV